MPAKSSVTSLQSELKKLKAENKQLKSENQSLKGATMPKKPQAKTNRRFWSKFGIIMAVGLAGALLVVGNLLFWAGRAVVDEKRFIATTGPLIQQPAIQEAVASYATTELYKSVDVEQFTADALPPRVSFLAPALSTQIQTYTQKTIQSLLGNQRFQNIWTTTLTTAHSKIINYARTYQGDGVISLADIYQGISKDLANTNLSFLANKTLPSKVGSITVVEVSWLPTLHNVVVNLNLWENIAVVAVVMLSILAVVLAKKRRKMVIVIGLMFSLLMVASLLALEIGQSQVVGHVQPQYQAAAKEAAQIILKSLRMQTFMVLLVGLLVAAIAWVTGPYKEATQVRNGVEELFAGRLHLLIFKKEYGFTRWIGRYKAAIQWVAVAIVGLLVIFLRNLSLSRLAVYGLGLLVVVLVVEAIGAPAQKR